MLIPGISGGSIAIILGIYEKLLCSLNDLFKSFKSNFIFLIVVALGGVVGMFISSNVLDFFIKNFYKEMLFIFVGIIISRSIHSFVKVGKNKVLQSLFYVSVGLFVGFLITKIPLGFFAIKSNLFTLLLLGIFLAIALILPGISVSYVLLIFNIYEKIILAIRSFDFVYLFEVGLFLIIGIFIVIKVLHFLLINKNAITNNIIIGFIFSSIWIVLPKIYSYKEFIYFTIFVLIGFLMKKVLPNNK